MAVTLTAATLGAAIRTAGTPAENTEVARLLIYSTEAVTQHVPTAPDAVHDEAVIRLAAWLYDQPNVGRGEAFAGALRKSGAAAILLPYRIIGAGTTGEAVALAVNAGTADNPVTRVAIADGVLRVTDHKTGRHRAKPGAIIQGGELLQPVLYGLAVQALFPNARVDSGRLYYCTTDGEFRDHSVRLDERASEAAGLLSDVVLNAFAAGRFPALPREGACRWCDYRPVCGPDEERRVRRKPAPVELRRLRECP